MDRNKKNIWMKSYAELLINFGVNIQKGQDLVLMLPHEAREFGLFIVEAAYSAGSGQVTVYYFEHDIYRIKQENADLTALEQYNSVIEKALGSLIDSGAAILFLVGAPPDEMSADTSEKRKTAFSRSFINAINEVHYRRRALTTNSCIPFFPTLEYSSYMFPDLKPEAAQLHLMDVLTPILKLDQQDPVGAWNEHRSKLESRVKLLNSYDFTSLHFHGGGTDLKVDLVKNHIWRSAFGRARNGIACAFNLPSEELFTAPDWRSAEGTIRSTRETFLDGFIYDKATLHLNKGRIIKKKTEDNPVRLMSILGQDRQSMYLGEVALVAEDSPIACQPMSFKNLLFDENAGCHVAFGTSYPDTIKNGPSMNEEELLEAGMNVSKQHIDLIIGSKDLSVDGITNSGNRINLMSEGLWTEALK